MRKLITIILSLACFIGVAQEDYYVSYQQANSGCIDVVGDVFPTGNAASNCTNEADSVGGFNDGGNAITIYSVVSTDTVIGDDYAIRVECTNDYTYQWGELSVSGLNNVEYTATIRTRRTSGTGKWSLSGATVTSNGLDSTDYDANGTDWFEATIVFTPTGGSVTFQIYASRATGLTGSAIEISTFKIVEN